MNQLNEQLIRLRELMQLNETHVQVMKYDLERKYSVSLEITESYRVVEWVSIKGDYDKTTLLKIRQSLESYCKNTSKELNIMSSVR